MAAKQLDSGVPQVVSIVTPSARGVINLKKGLRQHLGDTGAALYFSRNGEHHLATRPSEGAVPLERGGNRVTLPDELLAALGWAEGDLLALVARPDAVAIKRFEVVEEDGAHAALTDVERETTVTRRLTTNPDAHAWVQRLRRDATGTALRHDPRAYLAGRPTLDAWRARRVAGWPDPGDDIPQGALVRRLIAERIEAQAPDGSWEGAVVLTARRLIALHDLGVTTEHPAIARGGQWLLARPQSPWNPGMFFGYDELVDEQIEIVAARQRREGGRFRERRGREMRLTRAGDPLFDKPCGPRLMWPNAYAVQALIATGYEAHPRMRAALDTLSYGGWCECGYQHGTSDWPGREPLSLAEAEAFERASIAWFRQGGVAVDELATMDLCKTSGERLYRVAAEPDHERMVYALDMPLHLQGCELLTARALAEVGDARLRTLVRAYLWRFAAVQNAPGGTFGGSNLRQYFHEGQFGVLSVLCRHDHLPARLAIMRLLPWLMDAQNPDGSWGDGDYVDRATHVALASLARVRDLLPAGFVRGRRRGAEGQGIAGCESDIAATNAL